MYIVKIVRGKLDAGTKSKLGAICTLKVHNREIIEEFARETNEKKMITNTETFAWQSQLRYYFLENVNKNYPGINSIRVHMVDAKVLYDYEYLGNSMRLVVTPLTDRC